MMYAPSAVPVMQPAPSVHQQSVAVNPHTQGQHEDLDNMSSVGPLKSVEPSPSNESKHSQDEEVDVPVYNNSLSSQNQPLYLGQEFKDDKAFDSTMNTYMVNTNDRLTTLQLCTNANKQESRNVAQVFISRMLV